MEEITYLELTIQNFPPNSLDHFCRRQVVQECWRRVDGKLVLLPVAYVEDWDLQDRRVRAEAIRQNLQNGGAAYGALAGGEVIGFAELKPPLFGSAGQYIDLARFHVSEPYRGRGIGRKLFQMACEGGRRLGAAKLYISAHSAREPMAVYDRLGCVEAEEIHPVLAAAEPCDVQMEYVL